MKAIIFILIGIGIILLMLYALYLEIKKMYEDEDPHMFI